jgi:hypothetical protein
VVPVLPAAHEANVAKLVTQLILDTNRELLVSFYFLSSSLLQTAYRDISATLGIIYATLRVYKKKTPWSESASELYRPSNRRLSAK